MTNRSSLSKLGEIKNLELKYSKNLSIQIFKKMCKIKYFEEEVKKYCFMWREGGQFSTEKYNSKEIN